MAGIASLLEIYIGEITDPAAVEECLRSNRNNRDILALTTSLADLYGVFYDTLFGQEKRDEYQQAARQNNTEALDEVTNTTMAIAYLALRLTAEFVDSRTKPARKRRPQTRFSPVGRSSSNLPLAA